jgi:hypothetical protein
LVCYERDYTTRVAVGLSAQKYFHLRRSRSRLRPLCPSCLPIASASCRMLPGRYRMRCVGDGMEIGRDAHPTATRTPPVQKYIQDGRKPTHNLNTLGAYLIWMLYPSLCHVSLAITVKFRPRLLGLFTRSPCMG